MFQTLAQWGVASALVALSKNDSKNIKELIARVLNAICKFAELRGIVVQQVLNLFFSSSILMKQQIPGVVWTFSFTFIYLICADSWDDFQRLFNNFLTGLSFFFFLSFFFAPHLATFIFIYFQL
jgi:hypothetical protein